MLPQIQYVALLRGINVGGNNIIKMQALRSEFEKMGFLQVRSYIQSGNVIFQSDIEDEIALEKKLEKGLKKAFNYEAKVLVRSQKDMKNTFSNFPQIFKNEQWKHNVIFLSPAIDSKKILNEFELKPDIEQLSYRPGVLFWSAEIAHISKSAMLKLSRKSQYKEMTIRNINTTKKILELMN